ncbi:MAG: efflux RND transporter periplasmic adaptor subunit [Deltaproteobacteria bacterium]|nr:efflux RND transporter periplasmic adaptor subunit [Deltaproteobacteria bacterium]
MGGFSSWNNTLANTAQAADDAHNNHGMQMAPAKPGSGNAAVHKGKRKIKYWVAPMDPTYIRNSPGKSPMGMDMVPVYEDQAQSGSVITIDPATIQDMGILTTRVKRRNLTKNIRTVGLVGYEEPRQYSINVKVSGWIEHLYVNQTGQAVKKGDKLLDIYSPDLVSAQEEFLLALRNQESLSQSDFPEITAGAKRLLASSRQRLKLWDVSDGQIAKLAKSRKIQKTMTIYSPYSGVITKKNVNEGMFSKAGMELFEISDISKVWVYADIYEYELPWVKVGQRAVITLPFANNRRISGKVTYIYPYMEAKTRTVKARLEFTNKKGILKPAMYVNVMIKTDPLTDILTIPSNAVLDSGDAKTVFVALGKGKFEPRQIKTGLAGQNGLVEVDQGLLENERVVTSAQFMLDSESNLRAAIQKMLDANKEKAAPAAKPPKAKENLDDLF